MDTNEDKMNQLIEKLHALLRRQDEFSREIYNLRLEIYALKHAEEERKNSVQTTQDALVPEAVEEITTEKATAEAENRPQQRQERPRQVTQPARKPSKSKSDLEKFIGENLINKIGIAITVIGVSIGAKYSIENDLISPLTRIIGSGSNLCY